MMQTDYENANWETLHQISVAMQAYSSFFNMYWMHRKDSSASSSTVSKHASLMINEIQRCSMALVFRFTIIWETIIVIIGKTWAAVSVIIQEGVESRVACSRGHRQICPWRSFSLSCWSWAKP